MRNLCEVLELGAVGIKLGNGAVLNIKIHNVDADGETKPEGFANVIIGIVENVRLTVLRLSCSHRAPDNRYYNKDFLQNSYKLLG